MKFFSTLPTIIRANPLIKFEEKFQGGYFFLKLKNGYTHYGKMGVKSSREGYKIR
jgi:hypothetical protein